MGHGRSPRLHRDLQATGRDRMSAALRLVDANGEVQDLAPYEELVASHDALTEELIGNRATIASQSAMIGRLKRQLEESDLVHHPQRQAIEALVDRWRQATGHPK